MAVRTYTRAFNGGEVSPSMYARIDDQKYSTGLALCKNFLIEPQGPITMRPGFVYVNYVKDEASAPNLIPFVFNVDQTMVLEFGNKYIRFHTQGRTLMSGHVPYEVTTPYLASEVFDIHYVQSADIITLVHPNHPPMELRRYGATDWRLITIQFGSSLNPPGQPKVTQSINHDVVNDTDYIREYAVTSLDSEGKNESVRSQSTKISCNPYGSGAYNEITWSAVPKASRYRVYRNEGGLWSYIGETTDTRIIDENIKADSSITPPIYDPVFNGAGNYPSAVSYYEQRRFFAGTINLPTNIWATRSGTESDMSYSLPSQDDDRIAVRAAAREANRIEHIVPLAQLVVLTPSTEWRVTSVNNDAISPSSISIRPQSYVGASNVQPLVISNQMIYVASRGGHLRECGFSYEAGGFITNDTSLRAPHLFDNKNIVSLAYSKAPFPRVWAVSSDGRMIAFTYVPEQQVGAFSTVETAGTIEAVCSVSEGDEDVVYVATKRTINGQTRRFIERMHEQRYTTLEDSVFMDCAGTYRGNPTTEVSGLSWLEGQEVAILADGGVEPGQIVKDGKISITHQASVIHVGLPYKGDIKTLPVALQLQDGSFGSGHQKNVRNVWFRVVNSSGLKAGPNFDDLAEYPARSTEYAGSPPETITDEFGWEIPARWSASGQVCVRQDYPLPMRIVSMTVMLEIV